VSSYDQVTELVGVYRCMRCKQLNVAITLERMIHVVSLVTEFQVLGNQPGPQAAKGTDILELLCLEWVIMSSWRGLCMVESYVGLTGKHCFRTVTIQMLLQDQ
jgi:hypothetical protein